MSPGKTASLRFLAAPRPGPCPVSMSGTVAAILGETRQGAGRSRRGAGGPSLSIEITRSLSAAAFAATLLRAAPARRTVEERGQGEAQEQTRSGRSALSSNCWRAMRGCPQRRGPIVCRSTSRSATLASKSPLSMIEMSSESAVRSLSRREISPIFDKSRAGGTCGSDGHEKQGRNERSTGHLHASGYTYRNLRRNQRGILAVLKDERKRGRAGMAKKEVPTTEKKSAVQEEKVTGPGGGPPADRKAVRKGLSHEARGEPGPRRTWTSSPPDPSSWTRRSVSAATRAAGWWRSTAPSPRERPPSPCTPSPSPRSRAASPPSWTPSTPLTPSTQRTSGSTWTSCGCRSPTRESRPSRSWNPWSARGPWTSSSWTRSPP